MSAVALSFKVPAGVEDGTRIRFLLDPGEAGSFGGPAGDLYVVPHVKEHAFFLNARETTCTAWFRFLFPQAALGTEITVPTLERENIS